MDDDAIKRLRELAERATPGPWELDGKGLWAHPKGAGWACVVVPNYEYETGVTLKYEDRDADYIAAASPDVVTALLDELERLREVDRRCGKDNCMGQDIDGIARWVRASCLAAAERERDAAMALLRQWDALIAHQYTGLRAAMDAMHQCAQATRALLGDGGEG
jgi:hypothetical protein